MLWQWFTVHPVRVRRARTVRRRRRVSLKGAASHYRQYKPAAVQFIKQRLAILNQVYCFTYRRVAIRNQASRWGSCSKLGNLNFHYKVVLLPEDLADYVLVHELCHLQELNHSKRFWNLVAKTIPDYRTKRKTVRRIQL